MKFKSDIEVQAGLKDSSGALGASGQILSSTNGNVNWVTPTVNTVARDVQNEVKAGVAINKGQAVYVTGADGTNIIVGLASNTSEATSSKTLGLLNATVAVNGFADVVQIGRLSGLNTIGAVVGDPVWLGTNGNLIYGLTNKPYAPAHLVFIGVVTRVNANNGEIFITVQNGFELKEIHDVDIITNVPINGDVLGYDGTLWVNKTIAEWLGYTPANASGTTNYVSKFTGANSLGDSQIFDNGTNVGIGIALPGAKLNVNGVVKIEGNNSLYMGGGGSSVPTWGITPNGNNLEISGVATNTNGNVNFLNLGRVGIGTTNPLQKLHVEGLSYFASDIFTVNNGGIFFSGNSSYQRGIYSNASGLTLQTLGNPKLTINDGGNVGIGTTSPNYILQARPSATFGNSEDGNISIWSSLGGGTVSNPSTVGGIIFGDENTANSYQGRIAVIADNPSGTTASHMRFYTNSGGGNSQTLERMRITSSGNVGIGTTSPTFVATGTTTLDVNGSTGAAIYLRANTAQGSYLRQTSNNLVIANNTYGDVIYNTGFAEAMRVTADRLVGIGTSAPSEKLDVYGVVRGVFPGDPGAGAVTGKFLAYSPSAYGLVFRGYNTGAHSIQVQREANDAETFPISLQPNGSNVGIGTIAPNTSALLDVDSRTQGFLPPRMDTGQRDNIASPAPGLMIFNLDTEQVDVFTSGSGWRTIAWV